MKQKITKTLIKYGVTIAVGGLMAFAVIALHGYAEAATELERCRILADAFTIPGVGEFGDVVWAPLSAYLFSRLYGTDKLAKWGAIFNFAEEILPFTDFCPTFTIAWFMRKFSK